MASAKMTLIGMYNYRNDIFSELVLPSASMLIFLSSRFL